MSLQSNTMSISRWIFRAALIIGIALIVLKFTHLLAWAWAWVLAPLWIGAGAIVLIFLGLLIFVGVVESQS